MRQWKCPNGCAGVLGPDKPRTDDVRRYCLPCSEKSGRLVKRTCPALDRKRAAGKARSTEKAKAKRDRSRAVEDKKWIVDGLDLRVEAKRFWNLPSLRERRGRRNFPEIEVVRRTREYSSGYCWYGRTPQITVRAGTCRWGAAYTLLHEMTHAVVGVEGHSQRYWNYVQAAAREAWPEVDFEFQHGPNTGHAVGWWIVSKLRAHYGVTKRSRYEAANERAASRAAGRAPRSEHDYR